MFTPYPSSSMCYSTHNFLVVNTIFKCACSLTEAPPLLFTTKCSPELGVSFGGSPVVYLHNANPANINKFQIKELQTEKLVETNNTTCSILICSIILYVSEGWYIKD